ncbi:MAG TPA: flagellar hook capping FlgD N-terminal domain-containing protein [Xanthobacteraceae bacterium]|nr:flagellar hook capping FlgD N-terminal domain-containing protein [Xanthobacteraceae bacterium]
MSTLSSLANAVSNANNTVSSALSSLGTTTSAGSNSSSTSSSQSGNSAMQSIAGNFDTFLQLLTTQLQNQDPLDPLDTDSFTQELVEFASVEQQVNMNTNLQTMISMQQTSEATSALQLVGSTVTVSGSSAALSNATGNPATWSLTSAAPATGHVTITSSVGTTAYTGTVALNSGTQTYSWNGVGNNGQTWPDGTYTISISATGATGQPVTVSTQMQGTVSAVNLSSNPPTLTVNGQNVQISQVTSITH